jgi:hypothetical protein
VGVPARWNNLYNLKSVQSWYGDTISSSAVTFMLKYEDYQGNKGTVMSWTHAASTLTQFTTTSLTNISNMKVWVEISGDSAGNGKGFSVTLDFIATGSECAEV